MCVFKVPLMFGVVSRPWRPTLTATTTMSTFAESQLLTVASASGHADLSVAVPFSFCVGVVSH